MQFLNTKAEMEIITYKQGCKPAFLLLLQTINRSLPWLSALGHDVKFSLEITKNVDMKGKKSAKYTKQVLAVSRELRGIQKTIRRIF